MYELDITGESEIRYEGCGCGVQVQPRFSVHAPCDYDFVGLSPGCTSFPPCLPMHFAVTPRCIMFQKTWSKMQ